MATAAERERLTLIASGDQDGPARARAALIALAEALAVRQARADFEGERARNGEARGDLREI